MVLATLGNSSSFVNDLPKQQEMTQVKFVLQNKQN